MFLNLTTKVAAAASICLLAACGSEPYKSSSQSSGELVQRPNILLILADDLGYTDVGVYGSEINTPNIDQLARDGLIMTDFHNQAVCAPTRAALLSGTDDHNSGGTMHQTPNQIGVPGYESYLNDDISPLPEQLQNGGYNTYMAGKWHLGSESHQTPKARGFDRSFALMQGGASHYADGRGMFTFQREAYYKENGVSIDNASLPEDFYSSDFYTDYIIDSIKQGEAEKPWFAYLAFTAPHWPLQAADEEVAKYEGMYDEGYEVLRAKRIAAGKEAGVIPMDAQPYPKLDKIADWSDLSAEEKKVSAKEMEIYAAMVDVMDQNIGRLISYLKETGQYDNTFIVFLADNGAEGADRNPGDNGTDWTFDNSYENMGRVGSHIYYGAEWAQAGVGVGRYYKSYASEGGNRGPAIINYPNMTKAGEISDAFASVIDLAPTFLDLANLQHATRNRYGDPVKPIQGVSMVPFVTGDVATVRPEDFTFGWETFGHSAIRKGDWKLLKIVSAPAERGQIGNQDTDYWGLYDMATDPGEVNDLSDQHPEIVEELLQIWEEYKVENDIVMPVR